MDFLPRPHRPLYPCPEITLLSLKGYSGGCFKTYPEREDERWHPRKATDWEKLFEKPPSDFVALIETWPLFGFLYAFFGEDLMKEANFVQWKGHPPYPVLTMQGLPRLFAAVDMFKILDNHEALGGLMDLHRSLSSIGGYSCEWGSSQNISLYEFIPIFNHPDIRSSHISLLTSIVIEMCFSSISLAGTGASLNGQFRTLNLSNTTRTMYPEFRLNGWCPADLVTNFHRFNTPCLYFLLQMSQPHPDVDHLTPLLAKAEYESRQPSVFTSTETKTNEVRTCNSQKCFAKVLNDQDYTTKHAYSDCSCEIVGLPSLIELSTILHKRAIPVIRSVDPDDEDARISIVEAEPQTEYIAISHVWSDGLGNPKANAIPKCQLQRLSHHVRSIGTYYGEYTHFWLDTICIPPDEICHCTCPVEPHENPCNPPCEGSKMAQAQRISLELMRKTYENAAGVLVLDSWLYESTCQDKSDVENLLKIFSSTWTRRLWTLQEGALAKSLHVQFLDRALNVDAAIIQLQETSDPITRFAFLSPILASYWQLRYATQSHRVMRGRHWIDAPFLTGILRKKDDPDFQPPVAYHESMTETMDKVLGVHDDLNFQDPSKSVARSLVDVFSAVYHRSTSMLADEALCLAALLDFDVGRIAAFSSAEDRMLEFWRMFHNVPRRIIFRQEPKMNVPGFHWAPRTLLRSAYPTAYLCYDERDLKEQHEKSMQFAKVTVNGYLEIEATGFILPIRSNTIVTTFWLVLPGDKTCYYVITEAQDASDPGISFKRGIEAERTYGSTSLAVIPETAMLESKKSIAAEYVQ
ncbi:uncharacterized protein FIESC28_11139 [Fusarium coffeatum]|uniref:Heterokaryon incompatibility domain-containing protein n=1 Tax=Fusarium coffeatum TaxID=231269 RepID=A0A366QMS9_9HYPO|nr:uncharacterized protein FIESC28_11139 [Fusarium coffeatum]RBR06229.1 hypothetical protein FIESC28_11139 [Fusarium coffeatum]